MDWIIENALARGFVTELVGPLREQSLASYAFRAAAGIDSDTNPVRALIVSSEDSYHLMVRCIIFHIDTAGLPAEVVAPQFDFCGGFEKDEDMLELLEDGMFGLVIIHDTAMPAMDWQHLAKKANCAVMVSHDGTTPVQGAKFTVTVHRTTKAEAKKQGVRAKDAPRLVRFATETHP